MNRKKALVGVTGIIGSGKSSAAQFFAELGAAVFDSDFEAKQVTEDPKILFIIGQKFGENVLDQNGKLNRSKMAEIVFQNTNKLKKLNEIIHPEVRKRMWDFVEKQQNDLQTTMIVIDSPLIYETDLHNFLNFIIVVKASEEICVQRVSKRSSLNREEILSRMSKQISLSEKVKRANFCIDNDKSLDNLKIQVQKVHQNILHKWSQMIHE